MLIVVYDTTISPKELSVGFVWLLERKRFHGWPYSVQEANRADRDVGEAANLYKTPCHPELMFTGWKDTLLLGLSTQNPAQPFESCIRRRREKTTNKRLHATCEDVDERESFKYLVRYLRRFEWRESHALT